MARMQGSGVRGAARLDEPEDDWLGDVADYDLLITGEHTPTEEIEAALNAGTAIEIVEHVAEGQPYDS